MSTLDPFGRSTALWLRAYPRRWRTARAAEVTEVLRDLAEPGAGRVDARTALALVRSGWAERWRDHPPLGTYLRHRLLDRPLPPRWAGWQRDDVHGRLFPVRFALTRTVGIAILLSLLAAVDHLAGTEIIGTGADDARFVVQYLSGFAVLLSLGKTLTHRREPEPERDDLGPFLPYVPLTPEPPRAPRRSLRRRTGPA
ncbi:hypothetical protein [Cellulomonas cellasea]|uniref:Uncharacterized protein n=1 Tax=Cellulomonas cellasea TaxID=43670 RepID=A0A4Y3KTQ2_9CELL|nr:hypothetical protein [Cellulomonas cellasea]GEA87811.1 hypothetical protein CCE01nite_17600 [Cellulomonas cellasea]